MGKYMRKGKAVGKVEVSQGTLVGVRTRARALALEKENVLGNGSILRHSCTSSDFAACSSKASGSHSYSLETQPLYMELRSRKLEKVVGHEKDKGMAKLCEVTQASAGEQCRNRSTDRPFSPVSLDLYGVSEEGSKVRMQNGSGSVYASDSTRHSRCPPRSQNVCKPVTPSASSTQSLATSLPHKRPHGILTRNRRQELTCSLTANQEWVDVATALENPSCSRRDIEVEPCFGESPIINGNSSIDRQSEHIKTSRQGRECTPDSAIGDVEAPGSTSRTRPIEARPLSAPLLAQSFEAPSSHEIEAFFSSAEQHARRRFINRYNFDPLLERPLRGRYEWFNM